MTDAGVAATGRNRDDDNADAAWNTGNKLEDPAFTEAAERASQGMQDAGEMSAAPPESPRARIGDALHHMRENVDADVQSLRQRTGEEVSELQHEEHAIAEHLHPAAPPSADEPTGQS